MRAVTKKTNQVLGVDTFGQAIARIKGGTSSLWRSCGLRYSRGLRWGGRVGTNASKLLAILAAILRRTTTIAK